MTAPSAVHLPKQPRWAHDRRGLLEPVRLANEFVGVVRLNRRIVVMRHFQLCFVLIAALPLGCATSPPATGFLSDYSRLEPHPKVAGARVYWNPDVDRSKYESILIDPIEVHFAREKDSKQPDPERIREFRNLVKKELEEAIAEHFPISTSQGQGVARLRIQAANIRLAKEIPRTRSYVPFSKYRMGSANVEAELEDSLTAETIVAWVGPRRTGGEVRRAHRPDEWEAVKANISVTIRTYINRIVNRVKEARHADKAPNRAPA